MKRHINTRKRAIAVTLVLCAASCAAFGQQRPPRGQGPGGAGPVPLDAPDASDTSGTSGQPGGHRPPPPPVIRALDTNRDGIIDASEIDNAPQSLRTLEKSGTDQLTIEELLGPPHRHHPRGQGQGSTSGTSATSGPDQNGGGDNPPPPPPPPPAQDEMSGTNGNQNGPPGPPPEESGTSASGGHGGHHRPPLPPVIRALDTNHDGIIEADEIDNAPQSLRTLEKGGVDQLTIPELLGPPPHGRGGPPPPPNGEAPPPPPDQSGTSGQNAPPPPPQ